MAAAGRREVRDIVDLVDHLMRAFLPWDAIIWAAVDKSPGFTPEGVIDEIRRTSRYTTAADWQSWSPRQPVDPASAIPPATALNEAEAFVARMPTEKAGLLFLENGRVLQPDPRSS